MSIDEKKTCTTDTKEKERTGICCRKEEQETYEHTIRTPKTGVCIIGAMKHDRR